MLLGGNVVAKECGWWWWCVYGLRVNLTQWEPDGGWYTYVGIEVGMHKQS